MGLWWQAQVRLANTQLQLLAEYLQLVRFLLPFQQPSCLAVGNQTLQYLKVAERILRSTAYCLVELLQSFIKGCAVLLCCLQLLCGELQSSGSEHQC